MGVRCPNRLLKKTRVDKEICLKERMVEETGVSERVRHSTGVVVNLQRPQDRHVGGVDGVEIRHFGSLGFPVPEKSPHPTPGSPRGAFQMHRKGSESEFPRLV